MNTERKVRMIIQIFRLYLQLKNSEDTFMELHLLIEIPKNLIFAVFITV